MSRTSIKRGATLQFEASVDNDSGPVDLTLWTITSQVRTTKGVLVGEVVATKLDQTTSKGKYRLLAQTGAWVQGAHLWDIAYSYPDGAGGTTVMYSETVNLYVELANTQVTP